MNDEWYYGEDGQQRGPVPLDELRDRLARGAVRPTDLVWRAGLREWTPAANVPELASVVPPSPPPVAAYEVPPSYAPPSHVPPQPLSYDPASGGLQSKATTSLVLGILSIVLGPCCCSPVGLVLSIAAIVLGRNARRAPNAGSATAGFICGIVGLVLNVTSCGGQVAMHVMNPNANTSWRSFNFKTP